MIGHKIQQHAHATLVGCIQQLFQISFGAQARFDLKQVGSIITMVRWAGKDGRQPEHIGAQLSNIIQFLGDAPDPPAVETCRGFRVEPMLAHFRD